MSNGRHARRRGVAAQHAATPRLVPSRALAVLLAAAGVVAACVGGGAWALADRPAAPEAAPAAAAAEAASEAAPGSVDALPVPRFEVVAAEPDSEEACGSDEVAAALAGGDASAVIAAFGGAESFRLAAVDGCVPLDDPAWTWVVVNKQRPLAPIDYAPAVVLPSDTRNLVGGGLRQEAADALDALTAAAADEGAGDMALQSGYRSYQTQVSTFGGQVGALGQDGAEAISARPGYSEHQAALAADVVACEAGSCGTIYQIAGTPQAQWLVENAWRFGWIIRYEDGLTGTTGYTPEPWHLRYVGPELAQAYHDGGFHTLEDFFGLPAAPDYAE